MKVRFAASPTGSLHIGKALGAVVNRNFGSTFLLRIDDTDPARNVEGGEQAVLEDLRWLGLGWDEGPVRQSDRGDRYREAAAGLPEHFQGVRLRQPDGSATYQLASVVDDIDFGNTHVIRGSDHRPNEPLHRALTEALGATAPEYIHLGLILGPDGKQLARRSEGASVASLRDAGIPPEAVRRYLEELGTPRHDVHLDLARIRSLAVEVLDEARQPAASILEPPSVSLPAERETLERFRELRAGANGALDKEAAKAILRELKAVGGDLRAVRRGLTGRESGPELWSVLAALPREETLRRIDAAL
ncbi:MAG TPA: glutamate--tRNA ligase family protein [Gaiellaceae bacterium]